MKREIYECDVTGQETEKEDIISFPVQTPRANDTKPWGSIDMDKDLVPGDELKRNYYCGKVVVFVGGASTIGESTAYPSVLGIYIPSEDGGGKTFGHKEMSRKWGDEFIQDLQTAVQNRYVKSYHNNE